MRRGGMWVSVQSGGRGGKGRREKRARGRQGDELVDVNPDVSLRMSVADQVLVCSCGQKGREDGRELAATRRRSRSATSTGQSRGHRERTGAHSRTASPKTTTLVEQSAFPSLNSSSNSSPQLAGERARERADAPCPCLHRSSRVCRLLGRARCRRGPFRREGEGGSWCGGTSWR